MTANILLFISGIGGTELLLIFLFLALPGILWLWAIIDVLKSDFKDSINKLIWIIVIAFIPFLGAILYLLIGRSQKLKPI
jgi:hypothetical protein